MLNLWRAAAELIHKGEDFVLALILAVEGSTPRDMGARFLVKKDGSIVGTIGGGLFETEVRNLAPEVLQRRLSRRVYFSFKGLEPADDEMICGGNAEVLLEFISAQDQQVKALFCRLGEIEAQRGRALLFTEPDMPVGGEGNVRRLLMEQGKPPLGDLTDAGSVLNPVPERRLLKPAQLVSVPSTGRTIFLEHLRPRGAVFIFGAGHVGAAAARLAAFVDFSVTLLDDRREYASLRNVPEAHEALMLSSFDHAFQGLTIDEDSFLVVVTRGHAHDKTVLAQALKTNAGYIGMIGSRRKIAVIYEALLKEGFQRSDFERVHAPIGVPIGGETPEEIAVSIVAEMIQVRHRKTCPENV